MADIIVANNAADARLKNNLFFIRFLPLKNIIN